MKSIFLNLVLLILPTMAMSESAYITDQLKAGLHEDKSLESPIVKIVATGTKLELIKREEQLSFVRDADGTSGWINNSYLISKAPDDTDLKSLQSRADNLENRLADFKEKNRTLESELKSQGKVLPQETLAYTALKSTHTELQQQFKAEKLMVGQLQIEITELRNRLGQDSDADALYQQIKELEEDKKKLEIQLAKTLDKYEKQGAEGLSDSAGFGSRGEGLSPAMRNMFIYLAITLVLGVFAGAYLMDLINRRRHGGFRI